MKKRLTSITLVLMLFVLIFPTHVKAAVTGIMPFYSNTDAITVCISFSGNTATCWAIVVGKVDTTNITVKMSIQRYESDGSFTPLKTWPEESAASDVLCISKNYAVVRGQYYRTYVEAQVTLDGKTETVTSYSNTVKCP